MLAQAPLPDAGWIKSWENLPAIAVLGIIALIAVVSLALALRARHIPPQPPKERTTERVASGLREVEAGHHPMPEVWRRWVRAEIYHVLGGLLGVVALELGRVPRCDRLAEALIEWMRTHPGHHVRPPEPPPLPPEPKKRREGD